MGRSDEQPSPRKATQGQGGGNTTRRGRRTLGDVEPIAPGTITSLQERRAGSARYVVAIDDRPAAVVSAEAIGELALRRGAAVDLLLAERLTERARDLLVFDKAVELLAVRARSIRELTLRLRRAGAPAPSVDRAVTRLTALGLLDDAKFARHLAQSRALGGGVSRRRIGDELRRRGVTREVVDDVVATTLADVEFDEREAALAVARRRLRALGSLDAHTRRRRLYAFLARRGYTPDVISGVLRALAADAGDDRDVPDVPDVPEDAGGDA